MQKLIIISLDVDTENSEKFASDLSKKVGIAIGTFIDDYEGSLEVTWKNVEDGHSIKIREI